MTARQVWEGVQIELNKQQAPSLLLEDYNYLFNKAINQYVNKRYNLYDTGQQTTDDVRVLKGQATIYVKGFDKDSGSGDGATNNVTSLDAFLNDAKYEFNLPQDYLHLLNCKCIYKVNKRYKCYNPGTYWSVGATRLTADLSPVILNNMYMRPSYKKPYYYINNVNVIRDWDNSEVTPTNPVSCDYYQEQKDAKGVDKWETLKQGTDLAEVTHINEYQNGGAINGRGNPVEEEIPDSIHDNDVKITLKNNNFPRFRREYSRADGGELSYKLDDVVERTAGHRYGNASQVRLEIRYGRDSSVFQLVAIQIDYIKAPQHIRLTQEQIDLTEDTSQIMEFPDYVCQEIINELVTIVMENASDPRTGTFPQVSTSIASPVQEQTKSKK